MRILTALYNLRRDVSQSSDPRVGSARNGSGSSGSTSTFTGSNSASASSMILTLCPVLGYSLVCFLVFLVVRRKYVRVYSPRSILQSLEAHERSDPLPTGWFNWMRAFAKTPDTYILTHASLDGFLFLRFLKMLCVIFLVGCVIIWPVLLALNAAGGGGNPQLDMLTYGNITNPQWHYANVILAIVFFSFVLYMISRECLYCINLRQAVLMHPHYAERLSSRTVLFTCVPERYRNEARLRRVFGDSVKRVWIPRDYGDLDVLVRERNQTAARLEKAEINLIVKANAARRKALKHGHPDLEAQNEQGNAVSNEKPGSNFQGKSNAEVSPIREKHPSPNIQTDRTQSVGSDESDNSVGASSNESSNSQLSGTTYGYGQSGPPQDIPGSVASQWIPHNERPNHRPIANLFRKRDTIQWSRTKLKELARGIAREKKKQSTGENDAIAAVFIEFKTQADAQTAFQTLPHHRPLHMAPRYIGIPPKDVLWSTLRIKWWERFVRRFAMQGLIALMIIFWSIPAAFVGLLSNVGYVATKVPFLGWILDLPSSVLGLIEGLLPALALSLLMSIAPWILRGVAKIAGIPSRSFVELYVQNAYFLFQVVQVFLVTTLTSAVSGALTQILENPPSARELLAQNLPTASNFYLSYFIIQGFFISATRLIHVSSLVRDGWLGKRGTPKRIITRWHKMAEVHWGTQFPVMTNLGVIALTYCCIAPLILGFAGIGMFVIYLVYRYNLMFVYSSELDTRGLVYPLALQQLMGGLYLAEICLIGLFGISGTYGAVVIMLLFWVFTMVVHLSLNEAVGPLLYNMPRTLAVEGDELADPSEETIPRGPASIPLPDSQSDITHIDIEAEAGRSSGPDGQEGTRALEGAEGAVRMSARMAVSKFVSELMSKTEADQHAARLKSWTKWIRPEPDTKPNFFLKWLHPEVYADYSVLQDLLPNDLPHPFYQDSIGQNAYFPRSFMAPEPTLWIPRDPAGISEQEIRHTKGVIGITDQYASMDPDGNIIMDVETVEHPDPLKKVMF